MFTFLRELDERLYERYRTVERNVKAAGNSFYDAYLDMQEEFLRFALLSVGAEISFRESCGALLRRAECEHLFLTELGLERSLYDKMNDYALKVNAHKHKKEKRVALDTVLRYLSVFHAVSSAYAAARGIIAKELSLAALSEAFGEYERENGALRAERDRLKEELEASAAAGKLKESDAEALRALLCETDAERCSFEEENRALREQISRLKDIKLSSMEEKLNKTIDLLLELKPAIMENRVVTRAVGNAVGRMLIGGANVDGWIEEEKRKNGGGSDAR